MSESKRRQKKKLEKIKRLKKNKIINTVALIVIGCLLTSLCFFKLSFGLVKKDKIVTTETATYTEPDLRVLEIEPGNKFYLTNNTNSIPREEEFNNSTVVVTHITMGEFISWSKDINGQYDIVVVGRDNTGLDSTYSKDKVYRDYTNPLSQIRNPLPITTASKKITDTLWTCDTKKNSYTSIDNKVLSEYYAENDITNKKADEILKMINNGQLVYMDNNIFSSDINRTKLYTKFEKATGTNLIKVNSSNLNMDNIINKYNSINESLKRPKALTIIKPNDDTNNPIKNANGTDSANPANRNMEFDFSIDNSTNENLGIKLYLDYNGDSLYKEDECVEITQAPINKQGHTSNYKISCILSNEFIGYLDWKIQISKPNGIKRDIYGNSTFKTLIGQKNIKVLQIIPNDNKNLIDLGAELQKNTSTFKDEVNKLTDYSLNIVSKTVNQFNLDVQNGLKLNGNYDMVIIGFADIYGGNSDFNIEAINEIDSFIRTGQSVMFTHDTMALSLADKTTDGSNVAFNVSGPRAFSQHFRDFIGQARYADPYRLNGTTIEEKDIYKQFNITTKQYVDKTITHDTFTDPTHSTYNGNEVYTIGSTLQGSVSNENDTSNNTNLQWELVTGVKKINASQITQYPFVISDTIQVAQTHSQWYQLNLEDPDVVPWFNLSGSTFNIGDSRNNYYTYSKGNITYSGTGHSGGFTKDELDLFINTMIKAYRSANNPPIITTLTNGEKAITGSEFKFNVNVKDIDCDWVKISSIKVDNTTIDLTNSDWYSKQPYYKEGNFLVNIPKTLIGNKNQITVEIQAEDGRGAKTIKTYSVNVISTNVPIIGTQLNSGALNQDGTRTITNVINKPIDISYTIKPEEFNYSYFDASNKDVVVLFDTTYQESAAGNIFPKIKESFNEYIIDKLLLNRTNVNVGVVSFNENGEASSLISGTTGLTKDMVLVKETINNVPGLSKKNDRLEVKGDITNALTKADEMLSGSSALNKTIVIMAMGDIEAVTNNTLLNTIKGKGYNFITVWIPKEKNNGNNSDDTNYNDGGVYDLHDYLDIDNGDIISKKNKADDYIVNTGNSGKDPKVILMQTLQSRLNFGFLNQYIVKDAVITLPIPKGLDIGERIDLTSGVSISKVANTASNASGYPFNCKIKLPYIYYSYLKKADNTEVMQADNFDISFKVSSIVVGKYIFGESSITNTALDGLSLISNTVKTPIINVTELKHGIYSGSGNIDETCTSNSFITGVNIPMAAKFSVTDTKAITLTIDSDLILNGEVRITDGTFKDIGVMTKATNSNVYSYTIDPSITGEVFVIYNVKIKDILTNTVFTNTFKANGLEKSCTIKLFNSGLPDLF